jgi:hypothetical protein
MILSIIISVLSIIVGSVIIYLGSGGGMSSTGSFIVLSVLGAPLSFLHRVFWIFDKSNIPLYGMYFLYFLQYQLLAFGIYKFHDKMDLKIYSIIVVVIVISAILMYCFQMGKFV